ncbi:MAG: radical SAM protein, partial [Flavobacteriales bacterium]|nr:radical SAM protein [Flavobacteriales bacterium]
MAGIYFHIPFCRKACTYCDFHFSTSEKTKEAVRSAMVKELEDRANELQGTNVSSIYFGGGTPSLLTPDELGTLLGQARRSLKVTSDAEVTLEANPDDITADRLASWKEMGITRLSLGTQSFQDDRLQVMGRAHTAADALRSIGLIAVAGFHSWTIDLIYGLPGM